MIIYIFTWWNTISIYDFIWSVSKYFLNKIAYIKFSICTSKLNFSISILICRNWHCYPLLKSLKSIIIAIFYTWLQFQFFISKLKMKSLILKYKFKTLFAIWSKKISQILKLLQQNFDWVIFFIKNFHYQSFVNLIFLKILGKRCLIVNVKL